MYRSLFPTLLSVVAVAAAPQDGANSEITYVKIQPVTGDSATPTSAFRESRIENLPLTIPGNLARNSREDKESGLDIKPFVYNGTEFVNLNAKGSDNLRQTRSEDTTESNDDDESETEVIEPTESTQTVNEIVTQTEPYEARTKAPSPRFLPKLSYFKKDSLLRSSVATNLVERSDKRRFRSKCRCEKIWNCPKLQITVPRCPNEYFLCCF